MPNQPDFRRPCSGCGEMTVYVWCQKCSRKAKCPHGKTPSECSTCDVESDLAHDANRERGR